MQHRCCRRRRVGSARATARSRGDVLVLVPAYSALYLHTEGAVALYMHTVRAVYTAHSVSQLYTTETTSNEMTQFLRRNSDTISAPHLLHVWFIPPHPAQPQLPCSRPLQAPAHCPAGSLTHIQHCSTTQTPPLIRTFLTESKCMYQQSRSSEQNQQLFHAV